MARAEDPGELRASFERNARLYFHAPLGTVRQEITIGGRPALELCHRHRREGPLVLYFHGGGYVFGSPNTYKAMLAWLCRETGGCAILPAYRKAPENPVSCLRRRRRSGLVGPDVAGRRSGRHGDRRRQRGRRARSGVAGRVLLAKGHPLPAGVFGFSPLTDLTYSGDSLRRNAEAEALLPASRVHELAAMYLGDADPHDPRASPLFADFTGAPPLSPDCRRHGNPARRHDAPRRAARTAGRRCHGRGGARSPPCLADLPQHASRSAGDVAPGGRMDQFPDRDARRKLTASPTCGLRTCASPARSAMVRATRKTR